MNSTVYFMDLRATYTNNLIDRLGRLLDSAGIHEVVNPREFVAVKLHFGERGNTGFIRPVYLRPIVDKIKALQGVPFLTDTNTLYRGSRSDAPHHIETAIQNGFSYSVAGAPLVIADGLRGRSETEVAIRQKRFETVFIGAEIAHADALVSVAHFKGHELTGFGGTLKNIGMGCASRKGKLAQHSTVCPKVKKRRCTGCGLCAAHCPQDAVSIDGEKAAIDPQRCIGCGECILVCPNQAVSIRWNASVPVFMEKMVEYACGALQNKRGKALFINFILDVSPSCDCPPYTDAPIVADIGMLASTDPVAVDQAAADLVNRAPGLAGTCLKTTLEPGRDKFKALYPEVDWTLQLEYAEKLGLGSRTYRLKKIA